MGQTIGPKTGKTDRKIESFKAYQSRGSQSVTPSGITASLRKPEL